MRHERRWKVIALLASGMLAGVVLVGTPAGAHVAGWTHTWNKHIKPKADKRYQKVPQGLQHYSIPGAALVPDDGTRNDEFVPGLAWCFTGGNFYAPVHLPNGAKIVGLHVDYRDDDGTTSGNGNVFITRFPFAGRGGTYNDIYRASLADTPTPGATGTVDGTLFAPSVDRVDTRKWAYTIIGQAVSSGAAICNIDVIYRVNAPFAAARVSPGAAVENASAQQ